MPTFAVIDNGSVENCIVADTLTDAESISGKTCVEYFAVTPGWKFVDNNFVAPTAEEAEAFAAKGYRGNSGVPEAVLAHGAGSGQRRALRPSIIGLRRSVVD